MRLNSFLILVLAILASQQSLAVELSGRVGFESRYFIEDDELQAGVLAEPELYWESDTGQNSFTFKVFARYDELDDERTHVDIREAMWLHVGETWELRTGVGRVFWGVTESNHLVDVINQTDFVESADGEQKLGQPMVQYTAINDWGVVDTFVLLGFRERTFPGENGRLGGPIIVDTDNAAYESSEGQEHLDFAVRYSHSLGMFDFGLSAFSGTNRDPKFSAPDLSVPYYDQMQQLGLDVQATMSDWLLKFEGIYRDDSMESFYSNTFGFEYTFINIADSGIDLGVLSEYSYDSRDVGAPILDNDLFLGARLTFNDAQSTDLLFGASQDLEEGSSQLIFVEGSRRIGESFKLTLDARFFSSDSPVDPVYFIESEDYSSLTFEWYY